MAFDAFMVVKIRGMEILQGESADLEFGKQKASEILSFRFTSFPESASGGQMEALGAGTDTAQPTTFSSGPPSPAASLKDPSELQGVFKAVPILKKSIAQVEEKLKDHFESLNEKINQVASATRVVDEKIDKVNEKVDKVNEKVDNAAADQASGNGKQESLKKAAKLKIVLDKFVDSASPRLLRAYCQAADQQAHDDYKPFEEVVLSLRKGGGSTALLYLKIILSQVDVTSYSLDSGSGTELPRETFTLSCETFKVQYTQQNLEGGGSRQPTEKIQGWDFEHNKAL
jgi:type VI protein secretion system component Hcp